MQPKSAVTEIDALADVADWVKAKMRSANMFIMGDLVSIAYTYSTLLRY